MKQQRGFALIAALLVMVVVVILVFGTAFTTMIDRAISANQRAATDAYYVARAGVEKYKTAAFQAFRYYLDHMELYNDELSGGNPTCGNFLSIGLDLNRNGSLTDPEDLIDGKIISGVPEGNGTYDIKFEVAGKYIVLTSVGHVGRARSTVQLVAQPRNAGALSYAIFAGDGQQNKFINGGANIYGSVYVEGDPEALTDADPDNDYVITSKGNFSMHNFYTESTLQDLIKDNAKKINVREFLRLNAITQEDLCSSLRVNHGKVQVGGSTTLGDTSASAGYKANMAGVHVGNNYNDFVDVTGGADVYADLKTGIDIDGIAFPVLDVNSDGQKFCARNDTKTWRECLHEDAENVNPESNEDDRRGIVITTTPPYANYATSMTGSCDLSPLISEETVSFSDEEVNCLGLDSLGRTVGFEYTYNSSTKQGQLEVYGLVNFRGLNLHFQEDVLVRFQNKAAFFVESDPVTDVGGNVTVDGDLLPGTSFPDKDVLGIIAEKQVYMSGATQNIPDAPSGQVTAGLFYAGELGIVAKSATVFGTLMTPKFCTTSNCTAGQTAKFVQVPGLEYNLTPGFSQLEGSTIPTYRIASFERR